MALASHLSVCSPKGGMVPWAQSCQIMRPLRSLRCPVPALSSGPVLQKPLSSNGSCLPGVGGHRQDSSYRNNTSIRVHGCTERHRRVWERIQCGEPAGGGGQADVGRAPGGGKLEIKF